VARSPHDDQGGTGGFRLLAQTPHCGSLALRCGRRCIAAAVLPRSPGEPASGSLLRRRTAATNRYPWSTRQCLVCVLAVAALNVLLFHLHGDSIEDASRGFRALILESSGRRGAKAGWGEYADWEGKASWDAAEGGVGEGVGGEAEPTTDINMKEVYDGIKFANEKGGKWTQLHKNGGGWDAEGVEATSTLLTAPPPSVFSPRTGVEAAIQEGRVGRRAAEGVCGATLHSLPHPPTLPTSLQTPHPQIAIIPPLRHLLTPISTGVEAAVQGGRVGRRAAEGVCGATLPQRPRLAADGRAVLHQELPAHPAHHPAVSLPGLYSLFSPLPSLSSLLVLSQHGTAQHNTALPQHNDPSWLLTVEQYYTRSSQHILHSLSQVTPLSLLSLFMPLPSQFSLVVAAPHSTAQLHTPVTTLAGC
ncbi:unnamed protein product, partial [Closterium sp. NIES-54]